MSALIGLPESSLFRLLLTLQSRGYLQQNRDGTYELTQKVLQGKLYEQAEKLREKVRPILQDLASQFDETSSLAYLFVDRIQAIDTVETFQEIRMTNKPGRVLPPHCSSMGKAITANQDRSQVDRILETYGLMKRTEKTLTDRAALLAEFEQIRQQGFALDREESASGGFCIAAAIPGPRVVAAISVSTPIIRMTKARQEEITAGVLLAAKRTSSMVGS
jgi:DNA-binding IclR family transcriptional regulator